MLSGLATVIIVGALLTAAWCFVPVARDRWIDPSHLVALGLVELAVVIQVVIAVVRLIGGDHPVEFATFIGYLLTTVLFLPAAVILSFMERTRWGSVIVAVGALTVAVLTLRLTQTWTPLQ